jgi:hypothetical protein
LQENNLPLQGLSVMTHLKSILLLLLSVAALCAASIFFLREESRNYFKELEVETSALADTRVCLTDAGDGTYYLMLPEADSSKAHFALDGEYSASIDGPHSHKR